MTDQPKSSRRLLYGVALPLVIAAMVILLDQVTKAAIAAELGPGGDRMVIPVIPGLVRFLYVQNTGAAFGLFQGNSAILTVLALGVVVVLAVAFRRLFWRNLWLSIALGLQFGGALGNIVDRVRHGYVVDFIDVSHWPTFNLADSAITIGVIILGIYLLRRDLSLHAETDVAGHAVGLPGRPAAGDDAGTSSGAGH